MAKAIERVWSGEAEFVEHFGKNNHRLRRLENIMYHRFDILEEKLDDKQKEAYQECFEKFHEYIFELQKQAFCDGFCFGSRITAESFVGAEQIMKYSE